jgi:hypothetical protein
MGGSSIVGCTDWWDQYCPVDYCVIHLWMTPEACAKRGAVLFSFKGPRLCANDKKIEENLGYSD